MLPGEDKKTLLDLARASAAAAVRGDAPPELRNPSGALLSKGAAFVTLRIHGQLRGCIGHVHAFLPLWESVRDMAGSAAANDSRFDPLRQEELPHLQVELSVLSSMTPIHPGEIQVGVHGLYVNRGSHTGLLLPQVAVEWKWTADEFLRQTYLKADLPPDTTDSEIYAFTIEKLS